MCKKLGVGAVKAPESKTTLLKRTVTKWIKQLLRPKENDPIHQLTYDQERRLTKMLHPRIKTMIQMPPISEVIPPQNLKIATDKPPPRQASYAMSPQQRHAFAEKCKTMLEAGFISKTDSIANSPVFLQRKSNGTYRFLIDLRRINQNTTPMACVLPRLSEFTYKLKGAKHLGTFDLKGGYNQIRCDPESSEFLTFTGPDFTKYQLRILPQGATNSPALFYNILLSIFADEPNCIVYMDDLLVFAKSFDEYVAVISRVLDKLNAHQLTINPDKSCLLNKRVKYIGHSLSGTDCRPLTETLAQIRDYPQPRTIKQLQAFIGLLNYYRHYFGKQYATELSPLANITRNAETKANEKIQWTATTLAAFNHLRRRIHSLLTLHHVDYDNPNVLYYLETDASATGIGFVCFQATPGNLPKVVYSGSRLLTKREIQRPPIEREALAIHYALTQARHIVLGRKTLVLSDHKPLRYLYGPKGKPTTNEYLLKLMAETAHYDYEVAYKKGKHNHLADLLSRTTPQQLLTLGIPFTHNDVQEMIGIHLELGHGGKSKIRKLLAQRNLKYNNAKALINYVTRSCICQYCDITRNCIKVKTLRHAAEPLAPLQLMATDVFYYDTKKILTCIDVYSRHTFAIILDKKNPTAKDSGEALTKLFSIIGSPDILIADNGPDMKFALPTTTIVRTSPYYPEANGIIERFHKELAKLLRIQDDKIPLQSRLQAALQVYNRRLHANFWETPFYRFYGRDPSGQTSAEASALQRLTAKTYQLQPPTYSSHLFGLSVGDLVLKYEDEDSRKKHDDPYWGPFRILKINTNGALTLRMIDAPYLMYKCQKRDVRTIVRPERHDWRINQDMLQTALKNRKLSLDNRIDYCASHDNALCPNTAPDVLKINLGNQPGYLNPPFYLLDDLAMKIVLEKPTDLILICPDWEEKLYFAILSLLPADWEPLPNSALMYSFRGVTIGMPRFASWLVHLHLDPHVDYVPYLRQELPLIKNPLGPLFLQQFEERLQEITASKNQEQEPNEETKTKETKNI